MGFDTHSFVAALAFCVFLDKKNQRHFSSVLLPYIETIKRKEHFRMCDACFRKLLPGKPKKTTLKQNRNGSDLDLDYFDASFDNERLLENLQRSHFQSPKVAGTLTSIGGRFRPFETNLEDMLMADFDLNSSNGLDPQVCFEIKTSSNSSLIFLLGFAQNARIVIAGTDGFKPFVLPNPISLWN